MEKESWEKEPVSSLWQPPPGVSTPLWYQISRELSAIPWFLRVVVLKLYPLVLADTINPGITQGLLVRGEAPEEEEVIRGNGR